MLYMYECVMQQTVAHLCYKEIIKGRKKFLLEIWQNTHTTVKLNAVHTVRN